MNNFLIDYTTYMRSLAEKHKELHHTTEEKHFFRGELEEFWDQFRSEANFPCLITERSENSYSGQISQIVKRRSTTFMVVDTYDQHDDYDDILLKMSRCESIAEQVLGRMMIEEDSPFSNIDTGDIHGEYLQNEQDRYVGYLVGLTFSEQACLINNSVWNEEN